MIGNTLSNHERIQRFWAGRVPLARGNPLKQRRRSGGLHAEIGLYPHLRVGLRWSTAAYSHRAGNGSGSA